MNKFVTVILLAALVLTGCAAGETKTNQPAVGTEADTETGIETETEAAAEQNTNADTAKAAFACTLDNGVTVTLGSVTADVLDSLGTITEQSEAPSCIYDGTDKLYTLDGAYTITSAIGADGIERITQINFLSDAVALVMPGGTVMIGSAEETVKSAFGTPAEDVFGVQKYELNGAAAEATVILTDGVVTSLSLAWTE